MTRSLVLWLLTLVGLTFASSRSMAQDGWPLFRGNPERTGAAAAPGAFKEKAAWQRLLLMDKIEGFDQPEPDQIVKALIERLRKDAEATILPAFFPVISRDVCIYRTHRDVRCVPLQPITLKEGKQEVVVRAGEINWMGVPFTIAPGWPENQVKREFLEGLLAKTKHLHWLWANPMTGAISTDGTYLYAIEDLPIPAISPKADVKALELREASLRNALNVFNVGHGKLEWDISQRDPDPAFVNSYFLGAPLPVQGKLYLLNEKAGQLRLMTIDLDRKQWKKIASPPLEKEMKLAKVAEAEQVPTSLLRRTQPLHLAHADGLLVCPTHAGVLLGVDRAKMESRWEYRYRDEKADAPTQAHWQAASPIIHKGHVIFTAADSPDIHCIGVDGKKKWSVPADKDLYLATAHDDIVLMVGKTDCRALALEDGKEKWKLEMGLPAGVGVKDGSLYYVPLKKDTITNGPTLWAIDLAKGKKARRVDVPYPDALGNLALARGMLVTQSVTHIAAFPLTKAKQ